jgi:hypothetical protein
MRARLVLATAIILVAMAPSVRAEMFGAGPVYGGWPVSAGGSVTCRVFNFGGFPVSLQSRQIFTNTNIPVSILADSCNVSLPSAHYCAFTGAISGNFAFSCRLIATGTETRLSGMAEIQDSRHNVLNSVPLTK